MSEFLRDAIQRLEATPRRVRELVEGLTNEQLSFKRADEFSLRENVAHLRDIDADGYEQRIARTLDEESPVLADVDGAKLALERDYAHQPLEPALAAFERSRVTTLARLQQIDEHALDRPAEFEGVGPVTLRRLLEMWMEHDAGHIEEMQALRSR